MPASGVCSCLQAYTLNGMHVWEFGPDAQVLWCFEFLALDSHLVRDVHDPMANQLRSALQLCLDRLLLARGCLRRCVYGRWGHVGEVPRLGYPLWVLTRVSVEDRYLPEFPKDPILYVNKLP